MGDSCLNFWKALKTIQNRKKNSAKWTMYIEIYYIKSEKIAIEKNSG